MSASNKSSSDRREFLAHVASAAVILAGTACAAPLSAASAQAALGAPSGGKSPFDDSWTQRVKAAKHRAVFDSPGVEDGLALVHATFFVQGYHEALDTADGEVVPVVVMRHQGTPMALGDALWEKYALGERAKVKDPLTGNFALRNPFIHVEKDDRKSLIPQAASLEGLKASGAVLLACNKAAMRIAGEVAQKFGKDAEEVRNEFRNGLAPGVVLQPSGIYAVLRAQDVGCAFIKST
ncbi:MAG: hypothetical protein ABJE47_00360 [bacterium]